MLRGNAKQTIFTEAVEYQQFEKILAQGLEAHQVKLHAYCWMKNHLHLALQVGKIPLSKLMQSLSQRYTVWFNHRHDRVGHLFQGRYKDILIDSDQYLLELIRYIHLNPVRANLVTDSADYPHSSHRAYSGIAAAPPWLTMDWGLGQFGEETVAARNNYLEFMGHPVKEEMDRQLCNGSEQGRILGGERFVSNIEAKTGNNNNKRSLTPPEVTPQEVVEVVAEVFQLEAWEVTGASRARDLAEARAVTALVGMDDCALTLTEISKQLQRDLPTLSRQVKALRGKIARNPALQTKVDEVGVRLRLL
ncbi:MAG: transposase [Gammaproteobacteria bacterium]|uniref:Transposase n=1 Tax=Candidatus Thiopontia autotrophica TaxID=2841688 RepID=A0A8J6NX53_9GAMM|nr:transposase [Candidatus Thiopontia autotrophica]MBL6969117.1 transposase [Gammaproteobacteria bacterium]